MNQSIKDELNQLAQFDALLIDKDMFSSELAILYRQNPNEVINYIQSVLEILKIKLQTLILNMTNSKVSIVSQEEMIIRNEYDSWNRLLKLAFKTKTNMIAYNQKKANTNQYGTLNNSYSYQPINDNLTNTNPIQQKIPPMTNTVDDDVVVWDLKRKPITKEGKRRIGKIELTERIAAQNCLTKVFTKKFINTMFSEIIACLVREEPVEIDNFAKFLIVEKTEREGYNPLTREKIIIPAGKVVKIRSSANVKRIINKQ